MAQVSDYLTLIPAEHSGASRYVQVITLHAQAAVDSINLLNSLPRLFDLDVAVGQQLDFTGQWIGLTRYVAQPLNVYFSWDTAGLGWDEGFWLGPFDPTTAVTALDDPHYRILLKARVVANQWDGTVVGAYAAWNTVFAPEGLQILIQTGQAQPVAGYFSWDTAGVGWDEGIWLSQNETPSVRYDNGAMTIILALLGQPDTITKALFTGSYLDLKAAGVRIESYVTQSVQGAPLFAWDAGPETGPAAYPPVPLAGWDLGGWGILAPGR